MKEMGLWAYLSTATMVIVLLICSDKVAQVNSQSQRVHALFVFGDSSVDVGNNNYLTTFARANYFPYGIDFSGGATGRFSNGKSLIDFIGEMLGVPSPPAFADPSTGSSKILNGVNYASAAGGILDESGQHYGQRYSLSQQIQNFESTLNQYSTMMNNTTLRQYLANSIVIMVCGSNDYINNYLLPLLYGSSYIYSAEEFGNVLIKNYVQKILALQSMGLRKFFLVGIGQLGCIPNQRATNLSPPGGCVDYVNQIVEIFNERLRSMVDQMNRNYTSSIFAYGDLYKAFDEIINNPAHYGFSVVDTACCGIGINRGSITCLPSQNPCINRDQYFFWDAFHPTQAAMSIFAWRAVHGEPTDCYPINLLQMGVI